MSIDLAAVRADTPNCEKLLHFNNAGASLTPQPVYDAIIAHLELEQRIGAYEAEAAASETIKDFYDALAEMLCCDRDEIAFVENATRAWDMAFTRCRSKRVTRSSRTRVSMRPITWLICNRPADAG